MFWRLFSPSLDHLPITTSPFEVVVACFHDRPDECGQARGGIEYEMSLGFNLAPQICRSARVVRVDAHASVDRCEKSEGPGDGSGGGRRAGDVGWENAG